MLVITISAIIASDKLLNTLKIPQPGTNMESVMEQLGTKLWDTSDVDVMVNWGSIKDTSFLQGKKLFVFAVSTPPCRAIEVYTDENNKILFVTWQSL